MWISDKWQDYELIDASSGMRLEKWGTHIFARPDPTALWGGEINLAHVDGTYKRSESGGGHWELNKNTKEQQIIKYPLHNKPMKLLIKPMGFKHMGVFPEQGANWDWLNEQIHQSPKPFNFLNLFGYTGAASVAAAIAGAEVVHVDASKGIMQMAKDNFALNGLKEHKVRYIVDDCIKFLRREVRRGNQYDGIVLDPPSYGRGPNGEVFRVEDKLWELLELCKEVLSDTAKFLVLNMYTAGISPKTAETTVKLALNARKISSAELGLKCTQKNITLPCGISVRASW